MRILSALLLLAMALLSGCSAGNTCSAFDFRFDAACEMTPAAERDKLLAPLAVEAADDGCTDVVLSCLKKMERGDYRDQTAASAALHLAEYAGKPNAAYNKTFYAVALEVARSIDDLTLRKQTVTQLAKGEH